MTRVTLRCSGDIDATARHRPILRENEATASRKLFKHLPGPPGLAFGPKTVSKITIMKFLNTFTNVLSNPPLLSAHAGIYVHLSLLSLDGDALCSLHDSNPEQQDSSSHDLDHGHPSIHVQSWLWDRCMLHPFMIMCMTSHPQYYRNEGFPRTGLFSRIPQSAGPGSICWVE